MAKNVLKNPGRALDITADNSTTAAGRNSKAVLRFKITRKIGFLSHTERHVLKQTCIFYAF